MDGVYLDSLAYPLDAFLAGLDLPFWGELSALRYRQDHGPAVAP